MHSSSLPVRVIPKEEAVFWLDKDGCWRNRHGKFQNPKIIARFHASIQKDDQGYYLTQDHPHYREKVYFPYEDTALFVVQVLKKGESLLVALNTGERLPLPPDKLFIHGDHLYLDLDGERVKFSERALVTMSSYLDFAEGREEARLTCQGRTWPVPAYHRIRSR